MLHKVSPTHAAIPGIHFTKQKESGKDYLAFDDDADLENYEDLQRLGIGGLDHIIEAGFGMDAIQSLTTTASIPSLIQFLQGWLPGLVRINTAARKIDEILGINTVGSWEDEQIIQQVIELTGTPVPYGDLTNVPLASWNNSFNARTIVRFEQGLRIGRLAEARAAKMGVSDADQKRNSAALQLEIQRNQLGFYGYNGGANQTYGLLNDPSLPAYVTVANPGGGTQWSTKNFLQITADIRTAIQALLTASQDTIDVQNAPLTLVLPTNSVVYLTVTSDFGISVRNWINQTYPNIRIVTAPQFNAANGGANVFYLFADRVNDESTDGGATIIQMVPAKFMVLGTQQLTKGYEEDYTNASAGVMVKRPYAVYRGSGI